MATAIPSLTPIDLTYQKDGDQLELSWPQDHTGWRLQIQTNGLGAGLGTNWIAIPDSQFTDQVSLPVNSANGSVFLRLTYP